MHGGRDALRLIFCGMGEFSHLRWEEGEGGRGAWGEGGAGSRRSLGGLRRVGGRSGGNWREEADELRRQHRPELNGQRNGRSAASVSWQWMADKLLMVSEGQWIDGMGAVALPGPRPRRLGRPRRELRTRVQQQPRLRAARWGGHRRRGTGFAAGQRRCGQEQRSVIL